MIISIENVKTVLTIGGRDLLAYPNLMSEFRAYLSVKVPGSFFASKHLKYHWDGIKYFLTKRGAMATGFLPVFLKLVEEDYPELDVTINDLRQNLPQFKSEFVSTIGSREIGDQYIHQKDIIESCNNYIQFRGESIYFPRGVVAAATNAGKTAVIAGVYLNLMTKERMLIIIHRKTIYKELVEYFESVFQEVGQINDKNYDIKPITIGMIQTMYRNIDSPNFMKDLASFNILAVDEAHHAGSDMYVKIISACPAGLRIFLSGSIFESDDIVANMTIIGLSGSVLKTVSKRYLMDRGISTPLKVFIHLSNTIMYRSGKRYDEFTYDECIDTLIHKSTERVSIINKIIDNRMDAGPILIAVEQTEHGLYLQQALIGHNKRVELIHSKDKEIIPKIEAFRDGEMDVLISTGVLKEGVNLPLISTLIIASGGRSKAYIKQWCGRAERKHESKTEVEVHDFYDIGRYVQQHSRARVKIYTDELFPIEYNFNIKDVKHLRPVIIEA